MRAAAVTILLLAAICVLHATYIESVAANVDGKPVAAVQTKEATRRHEPFVPLVAFQCGYRNKYMNKNGEWQDDPSSAASCLQGKYDMYPNEEITNIVEYSHMSHIEKWCKEDGGSCKHASTVRPYRCIVGEFVTESLQVPNKCHFSHVAGKMKCNDYKYWNLKAQSECGLKTESGTNQSMKLRSFAILEPCGLSMFRGVEYVCCPKSVEDKIEKVVALDKDGDDDDYDDDDEEEDSTDQETSSTEKADQDPYFKEDSRANEHDRFRDAEERLEKKHRKKVTKVITEWSELFERYNKMKEKDPKGAEEYKREMTSKFRKTVSALEEENKEQRTQIEDVHDERVQASLNEKKRQATHDYRAALAVQVGNSNKNNVLRTLKNYIKAEEKDRSHMLNRYRHLLRSDPEQAISFEPVLLHRLRYIDLRINGTLAMLRDFPELEKQVRPVAVSFWNDFRRDNTPEVTNNEPSLLGGEEKNERLIRLYKQTYEHNHPEAQLAFGDIKAASERKATSPSSTTPPPSTPPAIHHVVALKDVLSEKDEDSDEDQFDDNEDSDSSDSSSSKADAKKLDIDVKLKPLSAGFSQKGEKKPAKVLSHGSTNKKEEEDEEDEDDQEEREYTESNDKKESKSKAEEMGELNVAIEPIVSAPARKILEELEESPPAYARHDLLMANRDDEFSEQIHMFNYATRTSFAIAVFACAFILLAVGLFVKRRSRHPGFIEVDVCTPDDRHVEGLKVNGYENPTYSFFDSKA